MKRLTLLIVAIFIAEFSFSQSDFRKGYVITHSGDTLVGLVDYREGVKAYKSCDFKSSKSETTITYEPNSIIGYGFENDKFFQSRELSIKDQPSRVAFLEVIVRGRASLYRFEDNYFIEKDSSGLQQLINETKEVYVEGKRVLKNTNQHVGTINILLFDCDEIRASIKKIRLDEKTLTNLIEDYNRCKGDASITYKVEKPWTKGILGITSGVNISQLSFEADPVYEHLTGVFEVSKSPMIGISLDVVSPRLSERISFHGDLLYLSSTYYSYSIFENGSTTKRNYVTIELQQLKVPIGVRYTFPQRNFTPYFNMGISSTIHLSSSSKWVQEVESFSVVETYENEALTIKKSQLGFWGGCGVLKSIHNKLNAFVELRYERTDGIYQFSVDTQSELESKITNFQILIGIRAK